MAANKSCGYNRHLLGSMLERSSFKVHRTSTAVSNFCTLVNDENISVGGNYTSDEVAARIWTPNHAPPGLRSSCTFATPPTSHCKIASSALASKRRRSATQDIRHTLNTQVDSSKGVCAKLATQERSPGENGWLGDGNELHMPISKLRPTSALLSPCRNGSSGPLQERIGGGTLLSE